MTFVGTYIKLFFSICIIQSADLNGEDDCYNAFGYKVFPMGDFHAAFSLV